MSNQRRFKLLKQGSAGGGGGASAIGELSDVLSTASADASDEAPLIWNDGQGIWGPAGSGPVNGQLRKAAITLSSTNVDSDLTDFPVLITEDMVPSEMLDADGSNVCQNDGGDIRFSSDADGNNLLPMDLVYLSLDNDPANSVLECWVKVPSVTAAADTTIYVWYKGNKTLSPPAADEALGSQAVWSDYLLVLHLDDATGFEDILDSTANGYDFTGYPERTGGLWGDPSEGAYEFFPTDNLYGPSNQTEFNLPASGGDPYTVQMWIKPDVEGDQTLMSRSGEYAWHLIDKTGSNNQMAVVLEVNDTDDTESTASEQVTINEWNLLHMTHDPGTDVRVLVNGVSGDGDQAYTTTDTNSNQRPRFFRSYTSGTQPGVSYFDGKADEIRIRKERLSDAWAKAEYYNHSDPGTFGTAGTPEDVVQFAAFDPAYITQLDGSATEIISRGTNANVDSAGVMLIGRDAGGQAGTNTTHDDLLIMGNDTGPQDLSIFDTTGSFPDDLRGHMIIGHKNWQHMTAAGREKYADLVIGYRVADGLSHSGTAGDDGMNTVIGVEACRNTGLNSSAGLSTPQPENVIVGYRAMSGRRAIGSRNVTIGCRAGAATANPSTYANNCVLIGYEAGFGNTNIGQSVVIGYQAGVELNSGTSRCTIVGFAAGGRYRTGTQNTAIGYSTDTTNTDSRYTVNVGNQNEVSGDYTISIGSLNRPPSSMDYSILLGYNVDRSGNQTIPSGRTHVFYIGTHDATGSTSAPFLHGDLERGCLTLGYFQQAAGPHPMLGVFEWGEAGVGVDTYNVLKLMQSEQGPQNAKPIDGAFFWVDNNEDNCVKVSSDLPLPASSAREYYLAPGSVWDPEQEDGDDDIDLTNVAAMTHKTTTPVSATTLTFVQDTQQPVGSRGYIANENSNAITLAQGTGVTIKDWTAASGGAPSTGSVTVSQGEIYEWYKRGETEYWVWRVNS